VSVSDISGNTNVSVMLSTPRHRVATLVFPPHKIHSNGHSTNTINVVLLPNRDGSLDLVNVTAGYTSSALPQQTAMETLIRK